MVFYISEISAVMSPFLFLILFEFSLFFLVSWPEVCQSYLSFKHDSLILFREKKNPDR